MSGPADTDKCLRCDHAFALHSGDDATESWKHDCECCGIGEFIGEPIAVDDFNGEQMAAWRAARDGNQE